MHNKTLIICLHPYSDMGGATNKIIQMLNSLNKKNYEIIYIYIKKNFKLNLNSNIKTIKLKNKRMLFSFFEIRRILINYHKKKGTPPLAIANNMGTHTHSRPPLYIALIGLYLTIEEQKRNEGIYD